MMIMKMPGAIVLFALLMLLSPKSILAQGVSLDQGLDEIAQKVTISIPEGAKKTVAVMDFYTLDGNVTLLGRFVGEELITKLFETERFKVIERSLLEKALEELKFNTSDLVDPSIAKQVGRIVGADSIVVGTLSDLGQFVKINARVIMVESGEVIGAAGVQVIKDSSISEMLKKIIGKSAKSGYTVSDKNESKYEKKQASGNLITNGNFKNRYEGWRRTTGDQGNGSSKSEVASYSNSYSGQGLHISHVGGGYMQFDQIVDVVDTNLGFSATFQATSKEGPFIAFSGTGMTRITLQYMDERENVLGLTSLVNYVKNPFADSPLAGVPRLKGDTNKSHDIVFKNGSVYRDYKIDIQKELEDNLMNVNAKEIRKIAVVIWCTATHKQASTDLWISDISLSYK